LIEHGLFPFRRSGKRDAIQAKGNYKNPGQNREGKLSVSSSTSGFHDRQKLDGIKACATDQCPVYIRLS